MHVIVNVLMNSDGFVVGHTHMYIQTHMHIHIHTHTYTQTPITDYYKNIPSVMAPYAPCTYARTHTAFLLHLLI